MKARVKDTDSETKVTIMKKIGITHSSFNFSGAPLALFSSGATKH
jgi:hypothetical protein